MKPSTLACLINRFSIIIQLLYRNLKRNLEKLSIIGEVITMRNFLTLNIICVVLMLFVMSIQLLYAQPYVSDANTIVILASDDLSGERITHGGRI